MTSSDRSTDPQPVGVLFVCTGNACRSQIAEGFARACAPESVMVMSAGVLAAGVHPLAIEAMGEAGIDISRQTSNTIGEIRPDAVRIVVTLCDNAAASCPAFPGEVRRIHWPIADPILAVGSHDERLADFRRARDEIGPLVKHLMSELVEG